MVALSDSSADRDDGEAPANDEHFNSFLDTLTGPGLRLWDAVVDTDVRFTTPFKRPGFKGTAIDGMYNQRKLSDQLGAWGFRWGWVVASERLDTFGLGEEQKVIHSLILRLWFLQPDGSVRHVEHAGATTVAYWSRPDKPGEKPRYIVIEDYLKMSISDAAGKAMAQLGVSADVYMGRFDSSKHVRFQQEESRNGSAPPAAPKLIEHARSVLEDLKASATAEDFRAAALRVRGTFGEQPFWPQVVHADRDLALAIQQTVKAKAATYAVDLAKV